MKKYVNDKGQKGITLIALVITIIVLIILASISIATLFGNNGIIAKAIEAREKTKNAVSEEAAALNDLEKWLNEETDKLTMDLIIIPIETTINTIKIEMQGIKIEKYSYGISEAEADEVTEYTEYIEDKEYIFVGLEENKTYTITVKGKSPSGTEISRTMKAKTEPNKAPKFEEITIENITLTSFTIKAKATDADNDQLTYEFFVDNVSKGTISSAQGIEVSKVITGLTDQTTYNYYVTVKDGKITTTSLTKRITIGDLFNVQYTNGTDNMSVPTAHDYTQNTLTSEQNTYLGKITRVPSDLTLNYPTGTTGRTSIVASSKTVNSASYYKYGEYSIKYTVAKYAVVRQELVESYERNR